MEKVRIQKYLSDCGICSRRKAETEIDDGNVKVNGHPAQIGQKIIPGVDIVTFYDNKIEPVDLKIYIKLNKPRGYVSTLSDEKGAKSLLSVLDRTHTGAGARLLSSWLSSPLMDLNQINCRLDMVSFGPTLRGVHSPDEKLLIPTVEMVWNHLLAILENI